MLRDGRETVVDIGRKLKPSASNSTRRALPRRIGTPILAHIH
jgi:hypothetical protein